MKPIEASELVAIIAAAFPSNRFTEKTCQIYETMLADLDRELAHRAVSRLVCTHRFPPTVAEIRAAATDLLLGGTRLGGDAWGDVGEAVRRFGRYQTPIFDDPIVADCVRQLGWLSICDSTNDVADRARFIELYEGLAARARDNIVAGATLALPAPRKAAGGLKAWNGNFSPKMMK
jgi:hypothetical protein